MRTQKSFTHHGFWFVARKVTFDKRDECESQMTRKDLEFFKCCQCMCRYVLLFNYGLDMDMNVLFVYEKQKLVKDFSYSSRGKEMLLCVR